MKKQEFFIWIILTSMATAFSFAVDVNQMNIVLVGIMTIIPFLLFKKYPYLLKKEILIYLLIFSILISGLMHLASFRIFTILYSTMFLLTFIFYYRLIVLLPLSIDKYIRILKFILISYFLVLVIQQFCLLIDSPYIFNIIAGTTESFKLNSLSPEPSHSAMIITALMYSYICMQELKLDRNYNLFQDGRKDKYIWFIFLYPILTMGSGFAIVYLLIFLLKFLDLKKAYYILPFIIIAFWVVLNLNLPAVERVKIFGEAFLKLDPTLMMVADHAASIRIVPTLLYLEMFDLFNIDTWMGFGIDFSANFIPTLMGGIPDGEFRGGLFPSFFFDKGLICVVILFVMLHKFCLRNIFSFDTIILFILIFSVGLNTQQFWISVFLFATNKYFYQTYLRVENEKKN